MRANIAIPEYMKEKLQANIHPFLDSKRRTNYESFVTVPNAINQEKVARRFYINIISEGQTMGQKRKVKK